MAHRGGALHPEIPGVENTLHAFGHAVALGYHYLETDVHATLDGVLLAFHDAALDRVTDTRAASPELTAEQVVRAPGSRGEHAVPTMAELLEAFPGCRFNIDLKSARRRRARWSSCSTAPAPTTGSASGSFSQLPAGASARRRRAGGHLGGPAEVAPSWRSLRSGGPAAHARPVAALQVP